MLVECLCEEWKEMLASICDNYGCSSEDQQMEEQGRFLSQAEGKQQFSKVATQESIGPARK